MLAVLALGWVLHDFHIVQALRELARVDWKWVLVGMGFDVLSYGVQALRWKWLLHPFGKSGTDARDLRGVRGAFCESDFSAAARRIAAELFAVEFGGYHAVGKVFGSAGAERLVELVFAS